MILTSIIEAQLMTTELVFEELSEQAQREQVFKWAIEPKETACPEASPVRIIQAACR